jgi:CheY-like chemotaxis protein
MNGHELLGVIKADPRLRQVPTVVLTTSSAVEDLHRAYGNYANAFVTKPPNYDALRTAVLSIDEFFLKTAARPNADPLAADVPDDGSG